MAFSEIHAFLAVYADSSKRCMATVSRIAMLIHKDLAVRPTHGTSTSPKECELG